MKAERVQAVPSFIPVVITLESQVELDALTKAVGLHPFGNNYDCGYALYKALVGQGGSVKR